MPSTRRLWLTLAGALGAVLLLAGCAQYRLGTETKVTFRTVFLEPVQDSARVPQSRALLDGRLREAFLRDGRTSVVAAANDADVTLTVAITDYRREVAAVRENDTGLARKFNLLFTVACRLRDNRSGRMIWEDRTITVQREAFTDSGQLQAEYVTLPLLAEAAAGKIVHAALDVW
jgi:outer membrane lipopolysaccharide assembly protein LptE/RlpB